MDCPQCMMSDDDDYWRGEAREREREREYICMCLPLLGAWNGKKDDLRMMRRVACNHFD